MGAAYFTGASGCYIQHPVFNQIDCTMSCWVNADNATNGCFIKNGSKYGCAIGVGNTNFDTSGNRLTLLFESKRWITTNTLIGNGWHQVAIGVSGGVPFYCKDGVWIGSSVGTNMGSPDVYFYIGGYWGRNFKGQIKDVRIFNSFLGSTDIKNLYNNGSGLSVRDLGCGYAE